MSKWVRICAVSDVSRGDMRAYEIDGLPRVAIYHADDGFHCTADRCTHGDASLCEGWLDGHVISCPVHGGEFDIRDGTPKCFPATVPLKVFSTRVSGDDLEIEVEV